MHQGYSNLDEKRSKEERGRCFILPVTFSVSLPGTFRTFPAGSSGGSWRLACGGWMEVDWLHSVPVAGRLCCLGPQCAERGCHNSSFELSDMPLCTF